MHTFRDVSCFVFIQYPMVILGIISSMKDDDERQTFRIQHYTSTRDTTKEYGYICYGYSLCRPGIEKPYRLYDLSKLAAWLKDRCYRQRWLDMLSTHWFGGAIFQLYNIPVQYTTWDVHRVCCCLFKYTSDINFRGLMPAFPHIRPNTISMMALGHKSLCSLISGYWTDYSAHWFMHWRYYSLARYHRFITRVMSCGRCGVSRAVYSTIRPIGSSDEHLRSYQSFPWMAVCEGKLPLPGDCPT